MYAFMYVCTPTSVYICTHIKAKSIVVKIKRVI